MHPPCRVHCLNADVPSCTCVQAVGRELPGKGLDKITAEIKAVSFFKGDLAMLERLVDAPQATAGGEEAREARRSNSSSSSNDEGMGRAGGQHSCGIWHA
jgi:hypothetical protein